jgi:hypothetical protein
MRTGFEVYSGRRVVSLQLATTAQEAVLEYLLSIGCRNDELSRVGINAVSWRGAVYKAVPASSG